MPDPREELGPYRIARRIAVGGMAEIYLARHRGIEGLERTVVVKRILDEHEGNEEFVTMFLDEARLMAALSHPNIAQVFDLGRVDETHYLVMEYVRGPTLQAVLAAAQKAGHPGLPHEHALGIGLRIAEALHYVHERRDELGRPLGIVHRDLNPANVVVSYEGAVKLIDFGIAKAATKVYETRTGVIKGTYGYIAPEALTGTTPVDRRADVFALGILLYEMLVGKHPFEVGHEANLLDRILEARYPRPREVRPSIPAALDRLVARCLAPHPEGRPDSMQQLLDELAAHMGAQGLVPTLPHLAAFARELVPDEEGPLPLRRPTSIEPRPLFPRDDREPRDGGTRKIASSVPPPEDEPTRRAMPVLPLADDERPEEPERGGATARAGGSSRPTSPDERDEPTLPVPLAVEELAVEEEAQHILVEAAALAARERERALIPSGPPPPSQQTPERTLRLPARAPAPRPMRLLLGALGLFAGALAFLAVRGLVAGTAPDLAEPAAIALPIASEPVDAGIPPARALHVVSEPPGAHVLVDGVDVAARTPAVLAVDPRLPAVLLHVSLEGYEPQVRQVSTTIGEARFVLGPPAPRPDTSQLR